MARALTTFGVLIALTHATAQVPEAWKDWPPEVVGQVQPVSQGSDRVSRILDRLAPHGTDPLAVTTRGEETGGDGQWAVPQAISVTERLMVARFSTGDLCEQVTTWLRSLDRDTLVRLVDTTPRPIDDPRRSDAAITALIEVHGVSDQNTEGLTDTARLRLADYYRGRGDDRCVPLYQALLANRTEKTDGWLPDLFCLGMYLRQTGRTRESAELFASCVQYTKDDDIIADLEIEGARALWRGGFSAEAEAIYVGLLNRPLVPFRRWVALGDLCTLWRTTGRSLEKAQEMRSAGLRGEFGVEVQARWLIASAEEARQAALASPDEHKRASLLAEALRLYAEGVVTASRLDPQSADRSLERTLETAKRYEAHLGRHTGSDRPKTEPPRSRPEQTNGGPVRRGGR